MFRKILVAVDIAEPDIAAPALAEARAMADSGSGEVRLVNVRPVLPVTHMDFIPSEVFKEQEKTSSAMLAEIAAKVPDMPGRVSAVSRFGQVYSEVLAEAKDWGADLIIVSGHKPTMATYLLGSNSKKIVRHAECSVLVVRGGKKHSLFE